MPWKWTTHCLHTHTHTLVYSSQVKMNRNIYYNNIHDIKSAQFLSIDHYILDSISMPSSRKNSVSYTFIYTYTKKNSMWRKTNPKYINPTEKKEREEIYLFNGMKYTQTLYRFYNRRQIFEIFWNTCSTRSR